MNRHIFGFTIFVVIVKSTFLLYWAFFAPVNYYSQQTTFITETRTESTYKCRTSKRIRAELQNVAVDSKQGKVTANLDLDKLEKISELSQLKLRLHIFTADLQPVWSGEIKPAFVGRDAGGFEFVQSSPELSRLNRKTNYYAQVEVSSANVRSEHLIYEINQAAPVLFINGK